MRPALVSEFVGTAGLLAGVVGSGIMAEQLTNDVGLQLLQNALATAGVLIALILALQTSSGAHFNPAVTLAARMSGELNTRAAVLHTAAQLAGAVAGTIIANLMFDLDPIEISTKDRSGTHLLFAECIATLGLVAVIHGVVRSGRAHMNADAEVIQWRSRLGPGWAWHRSKQRRSVWRSGAGERTPVVQCQWTRYSGLTLRAAISTKIPNKVTAGSVASVVLEDAPRGDCR